MKCLYWKLGNMRKAQEWIVTCTDKGNVIVQSDKSIGSFNPMNGGLGKLNTKGAYFVHLATAQPFQFPADFMQACMSSVMVKPGDTLGGGCVIYGGTTEIGGKS